MFSLEDLDYPLPQELIAEKPASQRDASRLMVVDRSHRKLSDRTFSDIVDYFQPGDCVIFNRTRVVKARLLGRDKKDREIEILLVEMMERTTSTPNWKGMVKKSRRLKPGSEVRVGDRICIIGKHLEEGLREIKFDKPVSFEDIDRLGIMPIPPYIAKKREEMNQPLYQPQDDDWYQPVVAQESGSVAAPTASLHFSHHILNQLREKGVKIGYVTLHVGPGTFRPIETDLNKFEIHREWISVSWDTMNLVQSTKNDGRQVYAVGTTSTRALETAALKIKKPDYVSPQPDIVYEGYTDLFITSGFHFQVVDRLITNFHMPRSTLLLLIFAFADKELIQKSYQHAIQKKYRFYSYGDAMLIL